MKDQPAFPADERLLPAEDCSCSSCRQLRDELAAVALVTLVEQARLTFAPASPDAPQSQPEGKKASQKNFREPVKNLTPARVFDTTTNFDKQTKTNGTRNEN